MNLIDTGIEKGLIRFDEDRNFITYVHQNKKRNYNNPEEKVQAETFLTLVLIYGYPETELNSSFLFKWVPRQRKPTLPFILTMNVKKPTF